MKKEFRVKNNREFQKVINGKKYIGDKFIIYYIDNEFEYPRFGISASKKTGNAVIRSTIRRKVRALLQEILKRQEILKKDYVLIVRKKFIDSDYKENLKELENNFRYIWRKEREKDK